MPTPILQDGLFYKGQWTRSNETMVLVKLDYLEWSQKWIPGSSSSKAELLFGVRNELRVQRQFCVDQEEIERKVEEWEVRYHNFKDLITWPGVCYDESTNMVRAIDNLWDEIAQVHIFIYYEYFVYLKRLQIHRSEGNFIFFLNSLVRTCAYT